MGSTVSKYSIFLVFILIISINGQVSAELSELKIYHSHDTGRPDGMIKSSIRSVNFRFGTAQISTVGYMIHDLKVWDLDNGDLLREIRSIELDVNILTGKYSPDGSKIAIHYTKSDSSERGVIIFDAESMKELDRPYEGDDDHYWKGPVNNIQNTFHWKPDGTKFIIVMDYWDRSKGCDPHGAVSSTPSECPYNQLHIWDAQTHELKILDVGTEIIYFVRWHPTDNYFIVYSGAEFKGGLNYKIYDAETFEIVSQINFKAGRISNLLWINNTTILLAPQRGNVTFFDLQTNTTQFLLQAPSSDEYESNIGLVEFDNSNNQVLINWWSKLLILNLDTFEPIFQLNRTVHVDGGRITIIGDDIVSTSTTTAWNPDLKLIALTCYEDSGKSYPNDVIVHLKFYNYSENSMVWMENRSKDNSLSFTPIFISLNLGFILIYLNKARVFSKESIDNKK